METYVKNVMQLFMGLFINAKYVMIFFLSKTLLSKFNNTSP